MRGRHQPVEKPNVHKAAAGSRRPASGFDVAPRRYPQRVLLVVDHGPPARDALLDVLARLRAPDPLAPVTVAVPSPLAGLALRRAAGARAGFANVRFTALARLAELLGAPRLAAAGRRPLTPAVRL